MELVTLFNLIQLFLLNPTNKQNIMKKKIIGLALISVIIGILFSSCSRKCYCDPTPAKPTPRVIMPT